MIQLTRHMRILVAIEPADFRKGIDGLAAVCRSHLHEDPFTGTVFVFRNRRAQHYMMAKAFGCARSGCPRDALCIGPPSRLNESISWKPMS